MIIRKKSFFTGIKKFCFFILLFIPSSLFAQNFNGQWKGGFDETSYGFSGLESNVDYVLELQTDGSNVAGYSYTYFNEGKKRYYTICKLTGTLDRSTKEIVVTEIERVKFNTPPDFQNCFQVHKLHYVQDSADIETLRGTWMPAPNQTGNCGYGTTFLSRRIVKKLALGNRPPKTKNENITAKNINAKKETPTKKEAPAKKMVASKPKPAPATVIHKPVVTKPGKEINPPVTQKEQTIKDIPSSIPAIKKDEIITQKPTGFEPRRKDIIKTIPITQPTFRVDFYDNGVVDGDSITVFYNGKILLSHKMLTTNAISLTLSLDENIKENIITMYADNFGTIPPNTALMIVTDGEKRYEVHISSDTEKSGSVVFVHGKVQEK